jgi:hypothetical protein
MIAVVTDYLLLAIFVFVKSSILFHVLNFSTLRVDEMLICFMFVCLSVGKENLFTSIVNAFSI